MSARNPAIPSDPRALLDLLDRHGGVISRTARALGVAKQTLSDRVRRAREALDDEPQGVEAQAERIAELPPRPAVRAPHAQAQTGYEQEAQRIIDAGTRAAKPADEPPPPGWMIDKAKLEARIADLRAELGQTFRRAYRSTATAQRPLRACVRACMRHVLLQGHAPFASHLLYAQPGVLDDAVQPERQLGIAAGLRYVQMADETWVFTDLGISGGMMHGERAAVEAGRHLRYLRLAHVAPELYEEAMRPVRALLREWVKRLREWVRRAEVQS